MTLTFLFIIIVYVQFHLGRFKTYISVAEAHNRLSHWLKKVKDGPITITRRGKPVGVIISPDEYEHLHRLSAYLQMLRLSRSFAEEERDVTANELFQISRDELVTWQQILSLAQRFDRSAYNAAYVALAEAREEPLITGDLRLYNAVHSALDWVQRMEDADEAFSEQTGEHDSYKDHPMLR